MASSKAPSTALLPFFRRSAYQMYSLSPEKTPRLAPQGHFLRGVYGTFYLAISVTFYEIIKE